MDACFTLCQIAIWVAGPRRAAPSQSSMRSLWSMEVTGSVVTVAPPLQKHLLHRSAGLHMAQRVAFVKRTLATAFPRRQPQWLRLLSRGKCWLLFCSRCTSPPNFVLITRCTVSPRSTAARFLCCMSKKSTHSFPCDIARRILTRDGQAYSTSLVQGRVCTWIRSRAYVRAVNERTILDFQARARQHVIFSMPA